MYVRDEILCEMNMRSYQKEASKCLFKSLHSRRTKYKRNCQYILYYVCMYVCLYAHLYFDMPTNTHTYLTYTTYIHTYCSYIPEIYVLMSVCMCKRK